MRVNSSSNQPHWNSAFYNGMFQSDPFFVLLHGHDGRKL